MTVNMMLLIRLFIFFVLCVQSSVSFAEQGVQQAMNLTQHWAGYLALLAFALAYVLVILEEKIHLRKSKPILAAAALIWVLIGLVYKDLGMSTIVEHSIRHSFLEYAELFFFLLVAMTYINALIERGVFDELRLRLVSAGLGFRSLFWLTGILSFFISPIADNLTTALIMCAVVLAVGQGQPKFVSLACVNIVVSANAGGAFSPFGDITTLMVWQKGMVEFWQFFALFVPSVVNFLIPAGIMHFFLPKEKPAVSDQAESVLKYGGLVIVGLFILTIITAVCFHNILHIPPVFGMMAGLTYLKLYGFYLSRKSIVWTNQVDNPPVAQHSDDPFRFDVFHKIAQAEWDTLFFFYGVILAVGGLGFLGYLGLASEFMYGELGVTSANILVGILSAIVDNIPVMFAVLTMQPDMPLNQWLLVTLTAGVGGSLLSVGSAAGVALMGQARGQYTFMSHLQWTPVIALGYAASVYMHIVLSGI